MITSIEHFERELRKHIETYEFAPFLLSPVTGERVLAEIQSLRAAFAKSEEARATAEQERDEARGWAKDWQAIADTICTILDLGAIDPPDIADAVRSKFETAESSLSQALARIEELEKALEWYGEQARLCRLIHSEGDSGRHALAGDGGKRARSILPATPIDGSKG